MATEAMQAILERVISLEGQAAAAEEYRQGLVVELAESADQLGGLGDQVEAMRQNQIGFDQFQKEMVDVLFELCSTL